jgi:hypothetical protein
VSRSSWPESWFSRFEVRKVVEQRLARALLVRLEVLVQEVALELEAKHQLVLEELRLVELQLELEELRLVELQLELERQLEVHYQRLHLVDVWILPHYQLHSILRFSVGRLFLSKR